MSTRLEHDCSKWMFCFLEWVWWRVAHSIYLGKVSQQPISLAFSFTRILFLLISAKYKHVTHLKYFTDFCKVSRKFQQPNVRLTITGESVHHEKFLRKNITRSVKTIFTELSVIFLPTLSGLGCFCEFLGNLFDFFGNFVHFWPWVCEFRQNMIYRNLGRSDI